MVWKLNCNVCATVSIVFITYLTVLGPNTYSKLSIELLRSYTLAKSHVCSLALEKRVVHCVEKICAKKIRTVIVYRERVL